MSRSKFQWVPLQDYLATAAAAEAVLVAVSTRDGRNALGYIGTTQGGYVNLRSVDGLTTRAYPIADTKVIELPTPKWEFAAKAPSLPF